jgi:hypothetical protein
MFHVRRNPWLAQNMFMFAALTFVIGIVGTLTAATILHQRLDSDTSISTSKLAFLPKKMGTARIVAAPKISVDIDIDIDIDIVFSGYATSSIRIFQPEELDSYDEEERSYSDYGGLEIDFLEENGAVRNILHDYYFSKTKWRDQNMEPDDDVDA